MRQCPPAMAMAMATALLHMSPPARESGSKAATLTQGVGGNRKDLNGGRGDGEEGQDQDAMATDMTTSLYLGRPERSFVLT